MDSFFQPSIPPTKQSKAAVRTGLTSDKKNITTNHHLSDVRVHSSLKLPVSPSDLSRSEEDMEKGLSRENGQSIPTSDHPHGVQDGQQNFPQEQNSTNDGISEHKIASSAVDDTIDRDREVDYKKLMQRSVSQGMHGIMDRVVKETKCNQQMSSSGSRSGLHDRGQDGITSLGLYGQLKPQHYSPGMGERRIRRRAGREMALRTLVCSPMETASRKFPEFVFTTGPEDVEPGIECSESKDHANSDDNCSQDSQIVLRNESPSQVTEMEEKGELLDPGGEEKVCNISKDNTKLCSVARKLECDFKDNESKVEKSKSQSETSVSAHMYDSHSLDKKTTTCVFQIPYAHYSTTSRSVLIVSFETSLTMPIKYHSRASIYPNFVRSTYFSSEMDIVESLHSLLDIKFKHQHRQNKPSNMSSLVEKEHHHSASEATTYNSPQNNLHILSTESDILSHEACKSHLLCNGAGLQQTLNTSLERPSTFQFQIRRAGSNASSSDSTCNSSLDSPIKRELIMRKAAEAVKQRQMHGGKEKDDLPAEIETPTNHITRDHNKTVKTLPEPCQPSGNFVKSMDNLTMPDVHAHSTTPAPMTSSSRSLIFSDPSHNCHNAPFRRARSFHESSKNSQSLEAIHVRSPVQSEEGDEELLYTLQRKRPVTVLVRSQSSLSMNDGLVGHKSQPIQANDLCSNLTTTKSVSSQGLADTVEIDHVSRTKSSLEGVKCQKRFSLNRPTSAPPSSKTKLDGFMTSIHLKADKLWWNEL